MGDAVRLQYDPDLPPEVLARLVEELELEPPDLYPAEGFTAFTDLGQLYSAVDLPRLKDRPLVPHPVPAFEGAADVWSAIRERDILVHHPYQLRHRHASCRRRRPTPGLAINMTLYA
jgi:polyphosphate kinase